MTELLDAMAVAIAGLPVAAVESGGMGEHALCLAAHGWDVFPLHGKIPAVSRRDGGRGVLDATADAEQIRAWWQRYPSANIGARVPSGLFVLDLDPRKPGAVEALDELQLRHGRLPDTLTVYSGRGDGGCHRYYRHPGGDLTATRLPDGLDVKTSSGYCVVPPSVHPEGERRPYAWGPVATPVDAPRWLVELLREERAPAPPAAQQIWRPFTGPSIADTFSAGTSWRQILEPHGWRLVARDGDEDGSAWRHPTATSPVSATVRHGCLFVYSPNTPFDVTEAGNRHGYTRFRAYAVLNHRGDLTAAAQQLRGGVAA